MSATAAACLEEFAGAVPLAREAGIDPRWVRRLAQRGLIGTLRLPAGPPKYSRLDLQRLVAQSLQPARQGDAARTGS